MWEQLTPADIDRAKARAAGLRQETLIRHAEELRALDADEAEIQTIERLITSFAERYMRPVNTGAVADSAPQLPRDDGAIRPTDPGPGSPDPQQGVRPGLQIHQQVSNFGVPARRLLGG